MAQHHSTRSIRTILHWITMTAIGLALGVMGRQFLFPLATTLSIGNARLIMEGLVMGVIMVGIQLYALQQVPLPRFSWFILSALGWAVGWSLGWSMAWQLLGGHSLTLVLAGRGAFIGLVVGTLQWLVWRTYASWAGWWIPANIVGWAAGLLVATVIGGAIGLAIGRGGWRWNHRHSPGFSTAGFC